MKKIFALLVAMTLCLTALAGCGGGAAPSTVSSSTASSESAPVSSETGEDGTEEEYYLQDVSITNSTGVAIVELYISPSESDDWGSDLLNGEAFAADETVMFKPDVVGTADATWDILVVDEDGDEITFTDINLSSATALELHWGEDGETPTVSITGSSEGQYFSQDLDITNSTGVAIVELYISPSDEETWGDNMLENNTFAADETLHFSTELTGTADASWDIMIVDEDGDQVVFEGVNFSATSSLILHWGADGATPTVTSA